MRDPFDNLSAVRSFHGPVLVVHGRQDEVVGFAHAGRLVAAAPDARLMSLDCGHNDCPPDPARFWEQVAAFLAEAGVLPGPSAVPAGEQATSVDNPAAGSP